MLNNLASDGGDAVEGVDDDPQEREPRVQVRPDLAHRPHQVVGALHGVQAWVHRDHQIGRCGKRIHREHSQ